MTKLAPLCRYCGKPIAKRTTTVLVRAEQHPNDQITASWCRYVYVGSNPPRTIDDCRKLSNRIVVSVKRGKHWVDNYDRLEKNETIGEFTEWDGESFVDEFFCRGECARGFGYMAAKTGMQSVAHEKAAKARAAKLATGEIT